MPDDKAQEPIAEIPGQVPEGWDFFEKQNEPLKTKRQEETGMTQEDYEAHFRQALSGKSGEIVLSYLADYVMKMPGFDPSGGFYDAAASGFYRAGMQDLVHHIFTMKETRAKGTKK